MNSKEQLKLDDFVCRKSEGIYSSKRWHDQGNDLLIVSKNLEKTWQALRQDYAGVTTDQLADNFRTKKENFALYSALPRSRLFLLANAAEMFLKAGLVKLHYGCLKESMANEIQYTYGHKLLKMSNELELDLSIVDKRRLEELTELMIGGRYPIELDPSIGSNEESKEHARLVNERTAKSWREEYYQPLYDLVQRIASYTSLIGTSWHKSNTLSGPYEIKPLGYLSFLLLGELKPRIFIRRSDASSKPFTREEVLNLIDKKSWVERIILADFKQVVIYQDYQKKNKSKLKKIEE